MAVARVLEELELEEVMVGARVLDRGAWEPWVEEWGAAGATAFELGAGEAVLGEADTGAPDSAGVAGAGEPCWCWRTSWCVIWGIGY
jgi:hypothetical protein